MPRAYTKSGSIEKYESSLFSVSWTGMTGLSPIPDSDGNYSWPSITGYKTSTMVTSYYCTTNYNGKTLTQYYAKANLGSKTLTVEVSSNYKYISGVGYVAGFYLQKCVYVPSHNIDDFGQWKDSDEISIFSTQNVNASNTNKTPSIKTTITIYTPCVLYIQAYVNISSRPDSFMGSANYLTRININNGKLNGEKIIDGISAKYGFDTTAVKLSINITHQNDGGSGGFQPIS